VRSRLQIGPLAEREFRLLFLGRVVSFLGSAVAPVGLAFAVLDLTGSKSDLGLVLAARSVPQIAFLLVGGVWSDRLPRNRVMVASSVLSGASQAGVAVLLLTHSAEVWQLGALAATNGAASAFFFPASIGVVPDTVPVQLLQAANGLLRLARNAILIVGSAAGGVLVATIGPGWTIAIDAASFALGAVFIGAMSVGGEMGREREPFVAELRQGWQEFRARTWLWAIVLQFSLVNAVVTGAFGVLGPVVAQTRLGGAAAWGFILSLESAGLVVGGILTLRFRPQRMLLAASIGVLFTAPELVALGIPLPTVAIAAVGFVAGAGIEVFGVLWDTAMQENIPGQMLSRVSSYDALGSFVFMPVGQAAAGPVASALGVPGALYGAAATVLAATLAVLCVRDVRTLRRRAQPVPAIAAS
jgi:MFS family permease